MKPIIIAIDGYSSCGKSTLAKALAKKLNYSYMDTGAMYRAVTLFILRKEVDIKQLSTDEINHLIDQIDIQFQTDSKTGESSTILNGELVEDEIRGKKVSTAVSEMAQNKVIRKRMVELQQKAGSQKRIVLDGRDIGTKVFPEAELKIFMTAATDIRAERRYSELKSKGVDINLDEVIANLTLRDKNDTERKENPLRQAKDAILLDNSNLNQKEQLELVLGWIGERF